MVTGSPRAAPYCARLMEASLAEQFNYQDHAAYGSLLFGDIC
jgi:hypothetical protein